MKITLKDQVHIGFLTFDINGTKIYFHVTRYTSKIFL